VTLGNSVSAQSNCSAEFNVFDAATRRRDRGMEASGGMQKSKKLGY